MGRIFMIAHGWLRPITLRRAFVASLCLHAFLAAFFPAASTLRTRVAEPVETISFARLRPLRPKPVSITRTRVNRAPRPALPKAALAKRAIAVPRLAVRAPNPPAAPVAAAAQPTAAATQAAQPTAAPRVVANAQGTSDVGGLMPFGAELPVPVLDPRVVKRLRRLHVRVTLLVTVGNDGRTKSVVFQPPLDPLVEQRIVALLSDAAWDAAVCGGGIACPGRAVIKL
ncbi:MAG: hypothetical protein ACYDEK_06790 [Vulcanimicrobiaceae bacterium]